MNPKKSFNMHGNLYTYEQLLTVFYFGDKECISWVSSPSRDGTMQEQRFLQQIPECQEYLYCLAVRTYIMHTTPAHLFLDRVIF